jgi:hypothetical protein
MTKKKRPFLDYFKGYDIDPGPPPKEPPKDAIPRLQRAKERMIICTDCSEYSSKFKMCRQCGCVMPIKALLDVECPINKW